MILCLLDSLLFEFQDEVGCGADRVNYPKPPS